MLAGKQNIMKVDRIRNERKAKKIFLLLVTLTTLAPAHVRETFAFTEFNAAQNVTKVDTRKCFTTPPVGLA